MSNPNSTPLQLPIQPSSPSLQSHISALDHLSLQLQHLTSTTKKDVRIPLGSKASIRGEVIHTNDIKINVGPEKEWFIDMTAQEASQYVERRKVQLLEEHARILEGRTRPSSLDEEGAGQRTNEGKNKVQRASDIGLHPIFYQMKEIAVAGSSKIQSQGQRGTSVQEEGKSTSEDTVVGETTKTVDPEIANTPSSKSVKRPPGSTPQSTQDKSPVQASLVELLDDEGEGEDIPGGNNPLTGDDTTLNEEGLPIHEIRETLTGETIGAPPPQSSNYLPESSKSSLEGKEEDDYFSPEAVARRAALRRKLFNEDTSSDEEDESVKATTSQNQAIKAKGGIIRSTPASKPEEPTTSSFISTSPPTTSTSASTSTSKSPSSPPVRERRPSSSQPPPSKSILKPPKNMERKKSVSFDPSLPSPPSSPAPAHGFGSGSSNFGFPLPLAVDEDPSFSNENDNEFNVKPVPIIPTPQPGKKNEHSFAGLKKGFLDQKAQPQSSSSSSPISNSQSPKIEKPKLTAVKDTVAEKPISKPKSAQPSTSTTPSPVVPEDKPKKQSLFSQRLNHHEIDASAPNIHTTPSSSSSSKIPSLPKVSESKGTNTVKSGVIEKPPAAVQSGVKEQAGSSNLRIIERPLKPVNDTNQSGAVHDVKEKNSKTESKYHENFDDDEDDEDEFSEYSTGEEDEYDLDEALLAREVALEYHKRQIYKPLNRDPDDEEGEEGGVMLGLPSIAPGPGPGSGTGDPYNQTGSPMIINPTPDDLRRFIRIGKLENGNLVLAPGEESLETDDEDEEHETGDQGGVKPGGEEERKRRKERKENRDRIKRTLMGLEVPSFTEKQREKEENKVKKGKERLEQDWKDSLPPALASDSLSTLNVHDNQNSIKAEDQDKSFFEDSKAKINHSTKSPIVPLVPESESTPELSKVLENKPSTSASIPTPAPIPSTTTTTTKQTEKEVEKPKKVSRFKAARMAGNQ